MVKKFNLKYLCSKGAVLTFVVLCSLLTVIGSTFSWVTSSDTRINDFKDEGQLKTIISEGSTSDMEWKPGTEITREVSIYNIGTVDAIVRISFEEVMKKPVMPLKAFAKPAPEEGTRVIPEYCKTDEYTQPEWKNASSVFDTVSGISEIPAGLIIKVNASPSAINGGVKYRYAIYHDLGDGKYQHVTAAFQTSGDILTITNIKYWGYDGYSDSLSEAAWGMVMDTDSIVPIPPTDIKHPITDSEKKITIDYNNEMFTLSLDDSDKNGKWYYNPDDGFFYYLGKIEAGSFSPMLMKSLKLGADASTYYSGLKLNLFVHLQSVQNYKEALCDEWGLSTTSDIYQTLAAYCVR